MLVEILSISLLVGSLTAWFLSQSCLGSDASVRLKEFVGKVIPLGLMLSSLLLFMYRTQHNTENRMDQLEKTITSQHLTDPTIFSQFDVAMIEVLPSYEIFVQAINREIAGTKRRLHVVRIQNQQSSPTGEKNYFDVTETRLKKGEIPDYRRLVRAPTAEHIKLYEGLLDRLKLAPTFQMKLWEGEDTPINFDMVISDDAAILVFGNNDTQGVPAWGVCMRGKEMADKFNSIFEHLWNKADAVRLKDAKPLSEEELVAAKEALENQQQVSTIIRGSGRYAQ